MKIGTLVLLSDISDLHMDNKKSVGIFLGITGEVIEICDSNELRVAFKLENHKKRRSIQLNKRFFTKDI